MVEGAEQPEGSSGLFRKEALEHHLGESEEGDLLRLSPAWTHWTYWFLVVVVVCGLAYLFLGTIPVYEQGAAVFQAEGRMPLVSPGAGTVERIEVDPGERVSAGQVLVWFDAADERAELHRSEQEFELHLVRRLTDPDDVAAAAALSRIRANRELLLSRLEQRTIRAPAAGVVHDVRIGHGQYLEQGAHVLSLFPPEPSYGVFAMLPGHALPQLEPGMEVRLEISGYPYAYLPALVESVGEQAIGPSEMRRALGPEVADSIGMSGPLAVVRIKLDSDKFQAWDQEYNLHDGMLATAEIEVRQERAIYRLIPGLKALRGRPDA